jgi:hypothetical protein
VKLRVGLRLLAVVLAVVQFECGSGLIMVQVEGIGLGVGPPAPARTVMGVAKARSGSRVRRSILKCILFGLATRQCSRIGVVGF